jgi:hypothetical protein
MGILSVATCGCFCCLFCGIQSEDSKGETSFEPLKAVQTVLGMVFLPAVDLAQQFGVPCCCGLDILGIEATNTSTTALDDEDGNDDESEV